MVGPPDILSGPLEVSIKSRQREAEALLRPVGAYGGRGREGGAGRRLDRCCKVDSVIMLFLVRRAMACASSDIDRGCFMIYILWV